MKNLLLIAGVIFFLGTVILLAIASFLLIPWFPTRDEGVLHGNQVSWQNGMVGIYDYNSYPGSYSNKIEWHSNTSEDTKVLIEVYDETPTILVNEQDELVIRYLLYDADFDDWDWNLFIFTGIEEKRLSRTELRNYKYSEGDENLVLARMNSWDIGELKCYEEEESCVSSPSRQSKETEGWITHHKEILRSLSYKVKWDNDEEKYLKTE